MVMEENTKNSNMLIYIDYENIHFILKKYHTNLQEKDFLNVLKKHCKDRKYNILDIIVYCNYDINDLHESYHQTWLLQNNVEIRHTANKSKNFADLQIAVDVLEEVYCNTLVDGFIIISSDKDMMPLIKAIRRRDKIVELITTVKDCDFGVTVFPTSHCTLENLLDIKNSDGSEIQYTNIVVEDEIYNNLSEFVTKQSNSNYRHTNLKYYIESLYPRLKLMKYKIYRILKNLEEQGKIYIYDYPQGNGKQIAIMNDTNLANYQSKYPAISIISNYFTDSLIENLYTE